jgi:hypothetical protein
MCPVSRPSRLRSPDRPPDKRDIRDIFARKSLKHLEATMFQGLDRLTAAE